MDPQDSRLTTGRFLAEVAGRHADRRAICFDGRAISYRELERESRRLARGLIGAGVVKGARVAVHMANRPEWIYSHFAAGMLGAVLVPVNTYASRDELQYILRHGDASLLLMQASLLKHDFLADLLADYPAISDGRPGELRCLELPQLRRVVCFAGDAPRGGVESWEQLLAQGEAISDELLDACCANVEPADDGVIIYTSGTTSRPKGVLHSQRSGVLQGWRFVDFMCLTPEDRVYTTYPFFWTAGIAMSLHATLAAGGCLLLQQSFEAEAALDLIEAERATAVHAWPHQGKAMAEHPTAANRDLSCITKLDSGAALAPLAGVEKDEYGVGASYGLSETFTIASGIPADSPAPLRHSTHGKPWPGNVFRIVDPLTGERLAPGQEGEIALKGVSFMRGYYKLLPEQSVDEDGFFRTQDGGCIDADGYLHWSGRLSNIIKTGGANVSPLEIEETLTAYPGLRVGVALGVEHPDLGEAIVLCAVPVDGASIDEAELRAWLRQRLAAYKVPKRILVFSADELSYTGNQKIQVEPLLEKALARLAGSEIDGHRYG